MERLEKLVMTSLWERMRADLIETWIFLLIVLYVFGDQIWSKTASVENFKIKLDDFRKKW